MSEYRVFVEGDIVPAGTAVLSYGSFVHRREEDYRIPPFEYAIEVDVPNFEETQALVKAARAKRGL